MENEELTISKDLVYYIMDKSKSGVSMQKVSDALSVELLSDRNIIALTSLVDDYYVSKGFRVTEGSSIDTRTSREFASRNYKHQSGSKSSVMIAQTSNYEYDMFINDMENNEQRDVRLRLTLADRLEKQVGKNN